MSFSPTLDNGKVGVKRNEIAGTNDKQQITAVFAETIKGEFLLSKLISISRQDTKMFTSPGQYSF